LIPVVFWREDLLGDQQAVCMLNCEDYDVTENKINFKEARTILGAKVQDWYGIYRAFSFSFGKVSEADFEAFRTLLRSQKDNLKMLIDDIIYDISVSGNSFTYKKIWSNIIRGYVYDVSVNIEESIPPDISRADIEILPYDDAYSSEDQYIIPAGEKIHFAIIKPKEIDVKSVSYYLGSTAGSLTPLNIVGDRVISHSAEDDSSSEYFSVFVYGDSSESNELYSVKYKILR